MFSDMSGAMNTLSAPNSSSLLVLLPKIATKIKQNLLGFLPSNSTQKNHRGNARPYLGESFYVILQRLSERSTEKNELETR